MPAAQPDTLADAPGDAPFEAPPAACLNCHEPLSAAPRPRFCPACGQETNLRPPRIGEFLQQFGGAYFATEGALWRTLKLLLTKPGELTRQYLAGRRKHYVLPLRLYLSISVVVLLLLRLAAGVADDGVVRFNVADGKADGQVAVLGAQVGLRDGRFFCEGLPDWTCRRLQRRLDVDALGMQGLERQAVEVGDRFVANLGAAMFVLLPLFALWLKLAWIDRGLRYTEHLVFALHLHTFWFVALAVTLIGRDLAMLAAMVAVPAYALVALKRVYGGRWWTLLARAAAVTLLQTLTLAFVILGLVAAALLA